MMSFCDWNDVILSGFCTIWTNIWHFGPFNLVFTNKKRDDEMRWDDLVVEVDYVKKILCHILSHPNFHIWRLFDCCLSIFTFTTESTHIYFLWVKTNLTGSKGDISVQIYQKWSKRRLFGQKMTSYVENGVKYDKKIFQHYLLLLLSHFIYTFCGWK